MDGERLSSVRVTGVDDFEYNSARPVTQIAEMAMRGLRKTRGEAETMQLAEAAEEGRTPKIDGSEVGRTPEAEDSGEGRVPEIEGPTGGGQPEMATGEDLRKRAEEFTKRYGRLFSLYARDASLQYVPSRKADTFSFHPKELKVEVPTSWFANKEYTDDELAFANYHELSHFADMRENPEAYLDNFEQMKKDAEDLARTYCATHPEVNERAVADFYHGELHALYNCLDDIYVNNMAMQRIRRYGRGEGRESVNTLYSKVGYENSDLRDMPLHRQMMIALLRDEMVGETYGKSVVDEQVEKVLGEKIIGKDVRDLVEMYLKPKNGVLVDPEERYKCIRRMIQPKFVELLEVALEEQEKKDRQNREKGEQNEDSQQGGEDGERGGKQSEGRSDGRGESSEKFDPFHDEGKKSKLGKDLLDRGENGEEVIRQILDAFKEEDEVEKMSPEEKAEYKRKKRLREFDEQHGISEDERRENEEIQEKIADARKEMRNFWRRLIGKSVEYRLQRVGGQRKGRLDIDSVIRGYADITEAERNGNLRDLNIYEGKEMRRVVVDQPEEIQVTLLMDCSGSMSDKVEVARETAALLMYSLKDFNDEIDNTRGQTRTKLRASTQVIGFGSNFDEIKPFEEGMNGDRNEAEIIKAISKIDGSRGGTNDAAPLKAIEGGLTSDDRERMANKKLKKIVFEVTDGASQSPGETAEEVKWLAEMGVLVVGFQIGDVSEWEREAFEGIWNRQELTNGGKGIFVGRDVGALPERMMEELEGALGDIVI